jgi:uncharacterized phage protein gp47/JayE
MTAPQINVPIPTVADATANAARLLQQSLASSAQVADPAALTPRDLELARSNVAAIAFVMGAGLHGAYRYLRDFVARQAIPTRASGEFLDAWLDAYGLTRKPASAATGTVQGAGVTGSVLPANTLLQGATGQQYKVTAAATVVSGALVASVVAVTPGTGALAAEGAVLNLVSPVTGINTGFTVAPGGIAGGSEAESDEQAIYRLRQRLSAQPMGGSPADYARWALEVPGITRAWGVRNPGGPTTAGCIIMADGNATPGLPTSGQRDAVYAYIRDPLRGPPDELFVIIPTPVVVNVSLTISPDTTALRADVTAALKDLFFREAVPGGSIPHSHLVEAISTVLGEYNHQVISPTITSGAFFTTAAYNQLLVLGTVAFV